MPSIQELLRLKNMFGQQQPMIGNDLPSQGGIMGNMGNTDPFADMFKPKPDPYGNISFGAGPIESPQMAAQQMSPQQGMPGLQPPQQSDMQSRMAQMYKPETMANDRFNEMLGQYPQSQKPGWLKVIGATLADMARPGTGMSVIEGDRARKLADWKNQMGPAQQAADNERQGNVNNRTMAYNAASIELKEEAQQAKERNDIRRAKIAEDRAEVYRLKSLSKKFKFNFTGPTVMVTDESTGQVTNTGIDTGSISETDKMAIGQDNAMELIGERGRVASNLEGEKAVNRTDLAETRGWGQPVEIADPSDPTRRIAVSINQATGAVKRITLDDKPVSDIVKPGTAGGAGKGEQPTQTKVRQFNMARQLANNDPTLGKFIKISGSDFTIRQPGGFSGPTPEQHRRINDAIYGTQPAIQQPTRDNTASVQQQPLNQPLEKTQTNAVTGAKRVLQSTDGGKTWKVKNASTAAAR